jgi:large subunit ribosomal protein L28
MARTCKLTGKRPNVANNVSHANNKTKRKQLPNLQAKRVFVPELDRWVRLRLSTRALRTVTRKGLMDYLKDVGLTIQDVAI